MFTRRIYTCVKSIPGFEQTQVSVPDDISGPVAPGVVQPKGRAQLEADLERGARRILVEECHRHRGPAPKNRHHWPEKKLNRWVSKYGALFCVQHFFGTLSKDLSSYLFAIFFVSPWVDINVLTWDDPLCLHPQWVLQCIFSLTPVPPQYPPSHLIELDKISVE